jgi:hypothetical protein
VVQLHLSQVLGLELTYRNSFTGCITKFLIPVVLLFPSTRLFECKTSMTLELAEVIVVTGKLVLIQEFCSRMTMSCPTVIFDY